MHTFTPEPAAPRPRTGPAENAMASTALLQRRRRAAPRLLLRALASGAALALLFDPRRGPSRRAWIAGRLRSAARSAGSPPASAGSGRRPGAPALEVVRGAWPAGLRAVAGGAGAILIARAVLGEGLLRPLYALAGMALVARASSSARTDGGAGRARDAAGGLRSAAPDAAGAPPAPGAEEVASGGVDEVKSPAELEARWGGGASPAPGGGRTVLSGAATGDPSGSSDTVAAAPQRGGAPVLAAPGRLGGPPAMGAGGPPDLGAPIVSGESDPERPASAITGPEDVTGDRGRIVTPEQDRADRQANAPVGIVGPSDAPRGEPSGE
jgi:hypothetical protein